MEQEASRKTPRDTVVEVLPSDEDSPPKLKLFLDRPRKGCLTARAVDWNPVMEDVIIELVAQGHTLSSIASLPGMPSVYAIFDRSRANKVFKESMDVAFEARAEVLADTSLQIAQDSVWKTEKSDRLRIDTAKWLAQSYNKERYGTHTKVSTEHKAELTFLINTNVPDSAPKTIEIERRDPSLVFKDEENK